MSDKFQRTLKLDSSVNDRLVALCDYLGGTVNSYLLNEIGKCIARDEVSFKASQNAIDGQDFIKNLAAELSKLDS